MDENTRSTHSTPGASICPAHAALPAGSAGCLAVEEAQVGGGAGSGGLDAGDYVYTHDANGNVAQVIGWASDFGGASANEWHADRLVAHYEYAPFGGVISAVAAGSVCGGESAEVQHEVS